jgi:nicotinate-nucleotide adenylyltransferase
LTTLAERDSVAERFLLVGADIATQIASWRQPERIAELAQVVILARPGAPEAPLSLGIAGARPAQRLASRLVDVSSTEIRERVRAGRPIRGFVTDAVEKFIDAAGLYR